MTHKILFFGILTSLKNRILVIPLPTIIYWIQKRLQQGTRQQCVPAEAALQLRTFRPLILAIRKSYGQHSP
ncbi:hypothetical protein [uncultured Nostoc sp.]|uniref:hypothetical protein n=1 Tax=uncultured Nostoc sp. TaxID=340711 RepID=UPI0035C9F095